MENWILNIILTSKNFCPFVFLSFFCLFQKNNLGGLSFLSFLQLSFYTKSPRHRFSSCTLGDTEAHGLLLHIVQKLKQEKQLYRQIYFSVYRPLWPLKNVLGPCKGNDWGCGEKKITDVMLNCLTKLFKFCSTQCAWNLSVRIGWYN